MIFFAVLEYAILASTFTISKVAISHADPLFLIGVRMILSAPIVFLIYYLQKKSVPTIQKSDYWQFFLVSVFHIFLPFIGEFWALQFMSSAKTAITYSLTPFIAAILSYFLLKQKISRRQSLGLVIGLLGLLPILISGDDIKQGAGELFMISLPEIVLLLSVTSASYAWFLVSGLMKKGYQISVINGIAMFFGGVFSLILWILTNNGEPPIRGELADFALWTGLLIIVANVISYNFYGWLLKHLSITFMSAIGFLCPIFASLYGFLFLDEHLGFTHLAALLLVALGLWLFYRDEIRDQQARLPADQGIKKDG